MKNEARKFAPSGLQNKIRRTNINKNNLQNSMGSDNPFFKEWRKRYKTLKKIEKDWLMGLHSTSAMDKADLDYLEIINRSPASENVGSFGCIHF